MSVREPEMFLNFEELSEYMQDREEVTKRQRILARTVSIKALEIAEKVNREAINSVQYDREMYFSWAAMKDLIDAYVLLCEHSSALDILKKKEEIQAHALELIEKEKV